MAEYPDKLDLKDQPEVEVLRYYLKSDANLVQLRKTALDGLTRICDLKFFDSLKVQAPYKILTPAHRDYFKVLESLHYLRSAGLAPGLNIHFNFMAEGQSKTVPYPRQVDFDLGTSIVSVLDELQAETTPRRFTSEERIEIYKTLAPYIRRATKEEEEYLASINVARQNQENLRAWETQFHKRHREKAAKFRAEIADIKRGKFPRDEPSEEE